MPPLTVVLLTYGGTGPRQAYGLAALQYVSDRLIYPGPMFLHIADDGSPEEHRERLAAVGVACGRFAGVDVTDAARGGYGRSWNLATQVVHPRGGVVLPLEDDWELTREWDPSPVIDALSVFGCVRLGYLGYTQDLRGTLRYVAGHHYLALDPDSPEPHVFAGHPRLETVEWERTVGPWPEGLEPGKTEFDVAHIDAARRGVAWPLDLVRGYGDLFAHIGSERSY